MDLKKDFNLKLSEKKFPRVIRVKLRRDILHLLCQHEQKFCEKFYFLKLADIKQFFKIYEEIVKILELEKKISI